MLVAAAVAGLTATGLAADHEELVREGYRWAAVNGHFASARTIRDIEGRIETPAAADTAAPLPQ